MLDSIYEIVPLWHGSDASAIGYIIEAALIEDGFLTQDGKLAKKYTIATDGNESDAVEVPEVSTVSDTVTVEVKADQDLAPTGRKCPECGAHNLVKRDGCDQCENCGYKGSCG
jgi:ribonucleoside-diphosphate reductase alpha chain